MNKTYAVHTKLVETQDLKDMLLVYPTPAEYGDFYLFAQPHTKPVQPVIDMQTIEDIQEFDSEYQKLLNEKHHQGRWVYLSQEQGNYLIDNYYQPETETV
ncbi:hypothetical protein [Alteromonas sp. BMJM2]|uniref:hypothetical protein n=1 Tax=Alteromonas sp. BMJM2 TaxID=2954241 RepID=UPI0022B4B402|nr:hypothetical protein [Alteromonas sp. BMJM2]